MCLPRAIAPLVVAVAAVEEGQTWHVDIDGYSDGRLDFHQTPSCPIRAVAHPEMVLEVAVADAAVAATVRSSTAVHWRHCRQTACLSATFFSGCALVVAKEPALKLNQSWLVRLVVFAQEGSTIVNVTAKAAGW